MHFKLLDAANPAGPSRSYDNNFVVGPSPPPSPGAEIEKQL